jgi:hypothetical protein
MPFPPALTSPYEVLDDGDGGGALALARARLNDMIQSVGGDILKVGQPFARTYSNGGWRRLQHFLANLGYGRLIDEVRIDALPICGNRMDPATQCWIDWTGYFDGTQLWTNYALPAKCSFPLKIWDRVSGYNSGWGLPLVEAMDGLPATIKYPRNGIFDYRNDRIYFPGTTIPVDMRIRFGQYLPNFTTQGETQWYQQPVPIVGCLDARADYICVEACDGRDDIDSATFKSRAEGEAKLIFNRDVRLKNRSNVRRRPHSGPRNQGGGYGYGSW